MSFVYSMLILWWNLYLLKAVQLPGGGVRQHLVHRRDPSLKGRRGWWQQLRQGSCLHVGLTILIELERGLDWDKSTLYIYLSYQIAYIFVKVEIKDSSSYVIQCASYVRHNRLHSLKKLSLFLHYIIKSFLFSKRIIFSIFSSLFLI